MKLIFCIITLSLFLVSCGKTLDFPENTSSGKTQETLSGSEAISSNEEVQEPLHNISQTGSDMTAFLSSSEKDTISLSHTSGKHSTISFMNENPAALNVKITFPEGTGNLRLSQIIMPDGTSDGPFGIETSYELTQAGGYQLIFGENQMAGDPWSGNSVVELSRIER